METTTEQGGAARGSDWKAACLRRRAWAQSRESRDSEPEAEAEAAPQGPSQAQRDEGTPGPSEEPGRVPNKITSWLIECRTPLGASLDDQTASPSRGAVRNGCSFEDDLSLGAEACLQSSSSKLESCYGVEQKRTQYKERGRSMNSTGSGKSSTVSSVSELLDLYEEDPEEILYNLGFGLEEPDLASKVPSRFFSSSSGARGIDVKVYLGAQLQRMELENPNYALTSRFRQIEVLTSVANEFFQLYSQVSGQPVQRISSTDQGGGGGGEGETSSSPVKRNSSALNAAKILKKTITKYNLLGGAAESPDRHTANHIHSEHTPTNSHTHSEHTHINGHTHTGPELDGCGTDPDQQGESANQKALCKKDGRTLATVTEETSGDGETDRLTHHSLEQSSTRIAATRGHGRTAANQMTGETVQADPERPPPLSLVPPQLARVRSENTDSFDMEEIQSNEDEALPAKTSRATDLWRTVSQQSDSSGFAEDPSTDSNSYLKLQESSDSCDSETTVTSQVSRDVATPLALDHPAFDRLIGGEEEELEATAEADGRCSSRGAEEHAGISEQVTPYSVHQLPWNGPVREQHDENGPMRAQHDENGPIRVQHDENGPMREQHGENGPMGEQHNENGPIREQHDENGPMREQHDENGPMREQHDENGPIREQHNENGPIRAQHDENGLIRAQHDEKPNQQRAERTGMEPETEHNQNQSAFALPPGPVQNALSRARQKQPSPSPPLGLGVGRGRGRGRFPLQRALSLPSSLLSPSSVVSSVRISFGRGSASCTPPTYSYRYCQDLAGGEEEEKEEEEEEAGLTSCLSTLIINPASSHTNSQSQRPHAEAPAPLRPLPIPRHLLQSSYSLQSPSPPPDSLERSLGGHAHSWSTQSVPDLFSNQLNHNTSTNQNQPSWNSRPIMFSYPNPSLNPNTCTPHPPQHPHPHLLHPHTSLPNLYHHSPSLPHHSSLGSLHQPSTPPISSFSNVHHLSLSNLHYTGTPYHHPQLPIGPYSHHPQLPIGPYSHHPQLPIGPYSHQSPYLTQNAPPYHSNHGYTQQPHLPVFSPAPGPTQRPASAPGFSLLHGHGPAPGSFPDPGSLLGLAPAHNPGQALLAGLQGPSSTEMQLRRVLHDIRGTVRNLNQNSADSPDMFNDHRAALPNLQSVGELQQKRRSLNLFRSHMMDLELSIIRQQALVYTHLSPADRLEAEQLQALRSEVREELQELEQQLEDRLTQHTHHTGFRGDGSLDSLSTASALRAMEPVSDLLREQVFLQSELSYEGHTPSTGPSSRSSSPVRRGRDRAGRGCDRGGVYRASINITPAPPPHPHPHTKDKETPEEGGARKGGRMEDLQELIREIRESVEREVRQEIYSELLAAAAVSPRGSPRQYPL